MKFVDLESDDKFDGPKMHYFSELLFWGYRAIRKALEPLH